MDPFPALADPVRRELLRTLADGPARVADLAAAHPISRPAVSKHLRVLLEGGLVSAESRGRERHYSLAPAGTEPVRVLLDDLRAPQRFDESVLDGLDIEVKRTTRDRRDATSANPATTPHPVEETA
jgi:DNA-binding transcriptional ArsR family regulator